MAEPFELIALSGFGGHTRVQGKARVVSHSTVVVCLILPFWQGLQGEGLATLLRTGGYTAGDGVPVIASVGHLRPVQVSTSTSSKPGFSKKRAIW